MEKNKQKGKSKNKQIQRTRTNCKASSRLVRTIHKLNMSLHRRRHARATYGRNVYSARSVRKRRKRKHLQSSSAGMNILHSVQEDKEKTPPVANGRTESHAGSKVIPRVLKNMSGELQIGFERLSPREIKGS